MRKINLLIVLILSCYACKKAENRPCFKNRGEEIIQIKTFGQIEKLRLGRGMGFTLVQDSINQVVIRTGQNMMNFISVIEENNELSIDNLNTCNFLRYSKNEIEIEVHFVNLRNIYFNGSELLKSLGNIQLEYLGLIVEESSAQVKLNLEVDSLRLISPYAWPQIELNGSSNFCGIEIDGDAALELSQFQVTGEFNLSYTSSQFSRINLGGTQVFKGQIIGNGNVGYVGTPDNFYSEYFNSGRFIPL